MKLFSRCLLFVSILIAHSTVHAQKDAPVVGDAIKIVQLIGKDYSSVSPQLRKEEIIRDRKSIIATFKSYMTQAELSAYNATFSSEECLTTTQTLVKLENRLRISTKEHEETKALNTRFSDPKEAIAYYKDYVLTTRAKMNADQAKLDTAKNELDLRMMAYIGKVFNNPYLSYVANSTHLKHSNLVKNANDIHSSASLETSVQKGIPFIGGDLSFETAIEGLSRFLASRIKEELTTYVITKVQEWLENSGPDSPLNELKELLPRTVEYLITFNADQLLNFTDEIKQYIESDFNNLLGNLPNLRHTPRIARILDMHPDMDFAFEALEMIPQLAKIKRPIEYFEILEGSRNIARWGSSQTPLKRNISNAMAMTCLIARSLTTMETGQLELVNLEDIDNYLDNNQFFQLYFGFLHQQNLKFYNANFLVPMGHDIPFKKIAEDSTFTITTCRTCPIPLGSIMEEIMNVVDSTKTVELIAARATFEVILGQLGLQIDKVNSTAVEIRKLNKKGEKIPVDLATEFIGEIINFADEIAIASDTLINFLIVQINDGNRGIDTIVASKYYGHRFYSIQFEKDKNKLKPVDIYERVTPYIAAARSTNQIIVDLHGKNYASAILTALEILSEIAPDNVLAELETAIEQITNLGDLLDNKKLALFGEIADTKKGPIKKSKPYLESVIALNAFLLELRTYHQLNYDENASFIAKIDKVRAILTHISGDNGSLAISAADRDVLNELVGDETFRKVIISYYTGKSIDKLTTELVADMQSFVISVKDDTIPLFSRAEALAFGVIFDNLAKYTFHYAVGGKSDKDKYEKLIKAEALKLELFIGNYAFAFPSKLNIEPNSQLFMLIHFVNDMARSETPEDVEKAIEAFALPSGSFAIKRTARWNVAINSYPGMFGAMERTQFTDSLGATSIGWSKTASLTVPVGLSVSRGSRKCGSIGLFFPIIDIGALTRIHLDTNANTAVIPDFTFKNILSPGVFVSYGFPKSALSINLGIQFGPELRRIENDEEKSYESWRIGAGLTLDIPLLNLFTKPSITRL